MDPKSARLSPSEMFDLTLIMMMTPEELHLWYNAVTPYEHEYVQGLLQVGKSQLQLQSTLLADPETNDLSEASQVLSKFTLGN